MSGAMVPRDAGDRRLQAREGRKRLLKECLDGIAKELERHKQSRTAIRDHLWTVYKEHLYMDTHDNFKDWFAAQPKLVAALSYRTAQAMLAEKRQPKKKKAQVCASSNQNGAEYPEKDMNGDIVPKNLRQALGDKWLQETYDLLAKVWDMLRQADILKGCKDRERFYPFIKGQDFRDGVGQVINNLEALFIHLRDNRPAAVCPSCKGKRCPDCLQSGLVPREIYRLLSEKGSVPA